MARKEKMTKADWQKFLKWNAEQQDIAEFIKRMEAMTGRELYEIETLSLYNKYLVNRPVDYAFHRTLLNYPLKPVDVMRDCLLDGHVILKVADAAHIQVEQFVSQVGWDAFTDELDFVETKYVFEMNGTDFYHIETFIKNFDGTTTWTIYKPMRKDTKECDRVIDEIILLPLFPFVGIQWVFGESFLEPLKSSIIRLEAAYQVIGVENVERMGLSLYIEGVRSVEDIKTAPRRMGRRVHILPKDSKFHSPSPDSPGMELMVKELENLEDALERASGVVSVKQLSGLSGVSRSVAEKPLIILADELRGRFAKGMEEVVELAGKMGSAPKLSLSYRPLKIIEDKNEYLLILDKARHPEEGDKPAISAQEYADELRLLLDLSPKALE